MLYCIIQHKLTEANHQRKKKERGKKKNNMVSVKEVLGATGAPQTNTFKVYLFYSSGTSVTAK